VLDAFRKANIKANMPLAAIYVWADLPDGEQSSVDYCLRMLNDTGVSTTPGIVFGKFGEGHFRISLGTATERISEAMGRIIDWSKSRK
jgi:LL-diaminopimelate aminotransferase